MSNESEQVAQIFRNLGADEKQAGIMAAQTLKRSEQVARDRNISQSEALGALLEIVVAGRSGEVPKSFGTSTGDRPASKGDEVP